MSGHISMGLYGKSSLKWQRTENSGSKTGIITVSYGLLDQPVCDGWNTQRTGTTRRFGNFFTLSPESRALSCCAYLPGDRALYAISVPRIKSGAGLSHSFALRVGRFLRSLSPAASLPLRSAFRRSLAVPPLPSANVYANVKLTGFTHRGLSPHKFTPMPGVP
jgi:hypothetical protein